MRLLVEKSLCKTAWVPSPAESRILSLNQHPKSHLRSKVIFFDYVCCITGAKMMEDALCWSAPGCDRVQLGSRDCWSRWMGVHGLTGYCGREPVRSQLFEKVDLSQFR